MGFPWLLVISCILIAGCREEPRLSDADVDRIAESAARKILARLDADPRWAPRPPASAAGRPPGLAGGTAAPDSIQPSERALPVVRLPRAAWEALEPSPGLSPASGLASGAVSPPPASRAPVLAAVSPAPAGPRPPRGHDPVLLRVEEATYTLEAVRGMAAARGVRFEGAAGRDFLEDLLGFEVVWRTATASGLASDPEYRQRVQVALSELAAHLLLQDAVAKQPPVTDATLRETYRRRLALLTEDEVAEVEEIYGPGPKELSALAKVLGSRETVHALRMAGKIPEGIVSQGKTTARPGQYPGEIWEGLARLAPGRLTAPFSTETGWMVLRLVRYRPERVPPLAEVSESMRLELEQARIDRALAALEERIRASMTYSVHTDRVGGTDPRTVVAEVDGAPILLQDLHRELANLPGSHRQRFSGLEGMRDLARRVAQKTALAAYARRFDPDYQRRHAASIREVERQELVRLILDRDVGPAAEPALAEIAARYAQGRTRYKVNQIRLRNISFAVKRPEDRPAQLARATSAIAELDRGGDFAALARRVSEDGQTRDRGGDMGWVDFERLLPPLKAALPALPPGRFTREPLLTEQGYHVMRVEARRDILPLEEVQAEIAQEIRLRKQPAEYRRLIARLRSRYRVEVHPEHVPPGAALSAPSPRAPPPAPARTVAAPATASPARPAPAVTARPSSN